MEPVDVFKVTLSETVNAGSYCNIRKGGKLLSVNLLEELLMGHLQYGGSQVSHWRCARANHSSTPLH